MGRVPDEQPEVNKVFESNLIYKVISEFLVWIISFVVHIKLRLLELFLCVCPRSWISREEQEEEEGQVPINTATTQGLYERFSVGREKMVEEYWRVEQVYCI